MKLLKIGVILLLPIPMVLFACTRTPEPSPSRPEAVAPASPENFEQVAVLDSAVLEGFLRRMGRAYQNRDTAFLQKYIAEDAEIRVDQDGRTVVTNKQQYIALLEKAWSRIKDYRYTQSEPVIAIQDDLANVHLVVNETGTVLGRSIRSEIDASIELRLVNGKIEIRQVTGQTNMSME